MQSQQHTPHHLRFPRIVASAVDAEGDHPVVPLEYLGCAIARIVLAPRVEERKPKLRFRSPHCRIQQQSSVHVCNARGHLGHRGGERDVRVVHVVMSREMPLSLYLVHVQVDDEDGGWGGGELVGEVRQGVHRCRGEVAQSSRRRVDNQRGTADNLTNNRTGWLSLPRILLLNINKPWSDSLRVLSK